MSLGSTSNQTLLTSHVRSNPSENAPQVVAESPPTQTHPTTTEKPKLSGDKRKSIPTKRELPSVTDPQTKNTTPTRKRGRLHFSSDVREPLSPFSKNAALSEHASHSRDRSNPGKGKPKPPRNNTLIRDFFNTAVKQNGGTEGSKSNATPDVASDAKKKTASSGPAATSTAATPSGELDRLRDRCQQLEQICHDKEEQLKAVSNNQTILHTALRASLAKTKAELEAALKEKESQAATTTRVIEKLVRSESSREASDLRQKLASDGARLGRIVYTRAGMRAVETWEDGNASKLLKKRRAELNAKREVLEKRQDAARLAAEQFAAEQASESRKSGLSALGFMEAEESVRLHLSTLSEKEIELEEEEQALNLEKTEHIRALKRVASEDSSRFRSKPKLHDRYILLSLLGKGGFSEVWRAYDLVELREVAVKIHQLDPRWSDAKKDNYTKHVSREYEIHRDVRHKRIVSLYDVFEIDNNSFATVLECCKGTDLDTLLKAKKRLPERDARAILIQILSGMQYLSSPSGSRQGIIHYDLKPGNILFDECGDAKITDFGLSKIVDTPDPAESMELTSQGAGTYWYLPPECFVTHHSVRISNKVDVWSIGVIYFQMLYGKRPFGDGLSQDRVLNDHTMLNARDVRFPEKPSVSTAGKDFIKLCLSYDQAFRPTVGQLCQNEYILSKQVFP